MRGGALAWLGLSLLCAVTVGALSGEAAAASFFFSTGNPNGVIAMGSRPNTGQEIEAADDFALTDTTSLSSGTFAGVLPSAAPLSGIQEVRVELYRVFPVDSDTSRTSGPNFSTALVPTRVNSPSDSAFSTRDSADGSLSFSAAVLNPSFFSNNSVLTGINPKPNQTTGGDGALGGEEVSFNVTFKPTVVLPAGHYFFVPQVKLASGDFLWLSAPKPITSPGTPFPAGSADLQAWIRNVGLDPDWLRVGTDIVGGATLPTYNATYSLTGITCDAITLAPASLPGATQGQAYSVALSASGGTAPYGFSETGALPAGLVLGHDGTLEGTPADSGSFPLTITATDTNGCTGSEDATLTVAPPPAGPAPIEPVTPVAPGPSPLPPAITSARLSPKKFRAARRGPSLARVRRPPVGATVSYVDSQAAVTTFTVMRPVTGHRRGSTCAAGRPRRHQKRCTRWVAVGSATHTDAAGSLKVRFSGRVRRRALRPSAYHLTLTPRANGLTGRTVTLAFRIVK